jgi:hypothetical protein
MAYLQWSDFLKTFKKPHFRGTVRGIGVLYLQSLTVVYYILYKLYDLLDCINFVFVTEPISNEFEFFESSNYYYTIYDY